MNSGLFKNSIVYLLILLAVAALIFSIFSNPRDNNELDITTVASDIKEGKIAKLSVKDDDVTVDYVQPNKAPSKSRKETRVSIFTTLQKLGVTDEELSKVDIEVIPPSAWGDWGTLAITILPLIIFGGLLFFMVRQAQGSNNQAMSFGKSRARMLTGDKPTVTFDDVAGADEAKQELAEVVEFLREPEKFISLGARIPKGVLMVGPPGCGKTLLAKAVAGEAGVPFFSISGSEFVEMFVGVGASRVRDLFDQAKRNSPCIIFVDEIDAVGRHRGAGLGGSHDEREQTLNQILVEMDGFDTDTNVIVIAATNRADVLDPALLRPGRFDRKVIVDLPDVVGREQILKIHARGKPVASEVSFPDISRLTAGFSGADLENLVNEAAIFAARRNKMTIGLREFQEAFDRIAIGPERKSRVISEEDKELTAYHEAGHAVTSFYLINTDPVQKITIIPRGRAGGYTMSIPEDRMTMTTEYFEDQIALLLGGRAAEDIFFGQVTTGASNDLQRATQLARMMVMQYGMSDSLGLRTYGEQQGNIFLGREMGFGRDYSEEAARLIDEEVREILNRNYMRAKQIINDNRDRLVALVERLIEVETLDRKGFEDVMNAESEPGRNEPTPAPELAPGD